MTVKRAFVGKVVLFVSEAGVDTRIRVADRAQAQYVLRLWESGCFGLLRASQVALEVVQASGTLSPLTCQLFEKKTGSPGWRISGPAAALLAANERGDDASSALLVYWERRVAQLLETKLAALPVSLDAPNPTKGSADDEFAEAFNRALIKATDEVAPKGPDTAETQADL